MTKTVPNSPGYLLPPTGHRATTKEIIPRQEATCTTDGHIAHFVCGTCGACYDEDGRTLDTVIIGKTGHIVGERNDGKLSTCTEGGIHSHYICGVCSAPFSTFNPYVTLTEEDLHYPADGHRYQHFERVGPTCEQEGNEEYYLCSGCWKYFDADKNPAESHYDFVIPQMGHTYGDLIAGTAASETEDGTISHYRCGKCGRYFDEDQRPVDTIVIPRTEHSFGEWHDEVSPTCHKDGTKGYYECSHCEKKFDIDYREITDLTLPAGHSPGKLIPASQGKCNEPDILVAYYQCENCGNFLDEALNELAYNGIFLYADRHNYTYSPEDIWGHRCKCLDCGKEATEAHTPTYSFYTEGGKHLKKAVCDFCGYEEEPMTYRPVSGIEMMSDFYVGYNEYDYVFRIFYRDGSDTTQCARNVMSSEEYLRYEALLKSLGKDFTPFTETFTITYDDYTAQIDITFHPYIIYGVVTADKVYQKGYLSDLYEIYYLYDCNYTRATGEPVIVHGEITDNDGFDSDFDFAAAGTDTKVYTIRYRIGETEYDVTVTYVNAVTPLRLAVHEDWVLCGTWPLIVVCYSNDVFDSSPLTPAMITGGSFDPSVPGKQTFTVTTEGITETFTITVRDPQEVDSFHPDNNTIDLGEKLYIRVRRCNGSYETIEVTPDMISGTFDPDTAGTYEIIITYGGELC